MCYIILFASQCNKKQSGSVNLTVIANKFYFVEMQYRYENVGLFNHSNHQIFIDMNFKRNKVVLSKATMYLMNAKHSTKHKEIVYIMVILR